MEANGWITRQIAMSENDRYDRIAGVKDAQ
jgi:hypothetical protein